MLQGSYIPSEKNENYSVNLIKKTIVEFYINTKNVLAIYFIYITGGYLQIMCACSQVCHATKSEG